LQAIYASLNSPVDKMRFLLVAHGFFNTHEGFFLYYRDGRM